MSILDLLLYDIDHVYMEYRKVFEEIYVFVE